MRDLERIREHITHLTAGWSEHIEYAENVTVHTRECRDRGRRTCSCLQVTERRARGVRHAALLAQLQNASAAVPVTGAGGRPAPNKPASRPPGNTAPLELLDDIAAEAHRLHNILRATCGLSLEVVRKPLPRVLVNMLPMVAQLEHQRPGVVRDILDAVRGWVKRARLLLGYDQRQTMLRDSVCGDCGGGLAVAKDASTDVRCVGTPESGPCGTVYGRSQWLELARQIQGAGDE